LITATHLLVGGAVGSFTDQPLVALGLGIVSHAVCDMIPHFDFTDYRRDVALGVVVGVGTIVAASLRGGVHSGYLWGMIGGVIPDIENLVWQMGLMDGSRRIFPTHRKGGLPHGAPRGGRNLLVQGMVGALSLLVMFR
jgi:hypothetical protein